MFKKSVSCFLGIPAYSCPRLCVSWSVFIVFLYLTRVFQKSVGRTVCLQMEKYHEKLLFLVKPVFLFGKHLVKQIETSFRTCTTHHSHSQPEIQNEIRSCSNSSLHCCYCRVGYTLQGFDLSDDW